MPKRLFLNGLLAVALSATMPVASAQVGAISGALLKIADSVGAKLFGERPEDIKDTTDEEIERAVQRHGKDLPEDQKAVMRQQFYEMRTHMNRVNVARREQARQAQQRPLLDVGEVAGAAVQGEVQNRLAIGQAQAATAANRAGVPNRDLARMLGEQGGGTNVVGGSPFVAPVAVRTENTIPRSEAIDLIRVFGVPAISATKAQVKEAMDKAGVKVSGGTPDEWVVERPPLATSPLRMHLSFDPTSQKLVRVVYEYGWPRTVGEMARRVASINDVLQELGGIKNVDGVRIFTHRLKDGGTLFHEEERMKVMRLVYVPRPKAEADEPVVLWRPPAN